MKKPSSRTILYTAITLSIGVIFVAGLFSLSSSTIEKIASIFPKGAHDKIVTIQEGGSNALENFTEDLPKLHVADPDEKYIRPFDDARQALLDAKTPFLEVNSDSKTIKYYAADGIPVITPIKTVGDPQGWGGTPAGQYAVLDKSQLAFSAAAQAYMPAAIHFYGKYFIHGEPYYPDGEKLNSDVSGGCVQVRDTDVQVVYKEVKVATPILAIDKNYDSYVYPKGKTVAMPKISAASYLVADLDSGQVLAEKDIDTPYPIASITKLMTSVVVAEHIDLRKTTTATSTELATYGTTSGLTAGGNYRLVELLYPLLIPSSNGAAEALTGFLGRARTLSLMNEKAGDLFMTHTHYEDPSGLDTANTSSAHDLYLLGRYILNNRHPLLDITKGKSVTTFGAVRFKVSAMENKNEFAKDPDFIGGKTGYTPEAKNTGLFLFDIPVDGHVRQVAIIVLKSEAVKVDAQQLKNWLTDKYQSDPTAQTI